MVSIKPLPAFRREIALFSVRRGVKVFSLWDVIIGKLTALNNVTSVSHICIVSLVRLRNYVVFTFSIS